MVLVCFIRIISNGYVSSKELFDWGSIYPFVRVKPWKHSKRDCFYFYLTFSFLFWLLNAFWEFTPFFKWPCEGGVLSCPLSLLKVFNQLESFFFFLIDYHIRFGVCFAAAGIWFAWRLPWYWVAQRGEKATCPIEWLFLWGIQGLCSWVLVILWLLVWSMIVLE